MEPKIERAEVNIGFGEAPHWDIENQCLYFVDMAAKTINRYEPATEKHTKASLNDVYPSFIIPLEGEKNKFVVGVGRYIVLVTWDGQSENVQQMERIMEIQNPGPNIEYRLNDGKCDTVGRLWTGTASCQWHVEHGSKGSVYSYEKGTLKNHAGEVTFANGLCWSKDNKKFFYIDSFKKTIDQFDFDINTGKITNRSVLFSYEENHIIDVLPDGMTIDEDDNLWIANFDGGCVIKIDSRVPNTLLYTLKLPFKKVTSVAWGGENLDELYVTVGRMEDGVFNELRDCPIYKVSGLGTKGLPMTNFKY